MPNSVRRVIVVSTLFVMEEAMKKMLFAVVAGALLVAACASEPKKDYSREQEKAREHGQEAFQAPEVNE